MKARAMLGIVAVGLLLMMPATPVWAVHGSPYVARGIAYISAMPLPQATPYFAPIGVPAGQVYVASVEWTGWWTQSYIVRITDEVNPPIVDRTFRGVETWPYGPGNGIYENQEFLWYHGYSLDPSVNFNVVGFQSSNLQTQHQDMLYTGNYNQYTLVLAVDDTV